MSPALAQILDAVDFAARKHIDQRRKNAQQAPYINHPIGVARLLACEAGIEDLATLQAAVLHDTVEDTNTSLEEIEQQFGVIVRNVVAEVTDDKSLPKQERKRLQVVNAPHKSDRAKLVKLADKLYNLRDLQHLPPDDWTIERVQEYFSWSRSVCKGCYGVNAILDAKLEDIFTNGTFLFKGETHPCLSS